MNPGRDITIMDEDKISDTVKTEIEGSMPKLKLHLCSNSLSRLSPVYNSENEDFTLNSGKLYMRHPDSYLPPLNNLSETEGESNTHNRCMKSAIDDDDGIRALSVNSEEVYLCRRSPYSSNISIHLCKIEDSELEEFLPKNRITTARDEI